MQKEQLIINIMETFDSIGNKRKVKQVIDKDSGEKVILHSQIRRDVMEGFKKMTIDQLDSLSIILDDCKKEFEELKKREN